MASRDADSGSIEIQAVSSLTSGRTGTQRNGQRSPKRSRTFWRTVPFNAPLNFDDLQLKNELEFDEQLAVVIYQEFQQEHSRYPRSDERYKVLREGGIRHGFPELFTPELIDNYLLDDLFPYDLDKPFHQGMRRLLGQATGVYSRQECEIALNWLCDKLTKGSSNGLRRIPTTLDVQVAVESREIVPKLGCPMPTVAMIRHAYNSSSFKEIRNLVLKPTTAERRACLPTKTKFEELVQDYKDAYKHFYGDFDPNKPQIVSRDQLKEYAKYGGLGYIRYQSHFYGQNARRHKKVNMNSVRQKAGRPLDLRLANRPVRSKMFRWDKPSIYAGYMAVWKIDGIHLDPPSQGRLGEVCKIQTQIINDHKGKIDPLAARKAGVPTTRVPSQPIVDTHFGGMTFLIGYAENISGSPIRFDDIGRVNRMATQVIKKMAIETVGGKSANDLDSFDPKVIYPLAMKAYENGFKLDSVPRCVAEIVRGRLGIVVPTVQHPISLR